MLNRQSKVIFSVLLVVSILLHALAWWWVDVKELFKPDPLDESTTVQVTLQQPPEPPKPPSKEKPAPKPQKKKEDVAEPIEQERHLPMHNADTFASSNNTDREVNKYKPDELVGEDATDKVGEEEKEKKKEAKEASKPENKKPVVVNNQPKNKKQENKVPKPDKSESASETKSKQVYSENKSDKLKMQNLYLKRMMKQITDKLITPRKPVRKGRGVIAIVLNGEGYLVNATITRSSGDFVLDLSVMEAIKRVHRYEVPDSIAVVEQYYTQLTIRYDQTIFDQ
jgi:outer membrane biosynthesis protein TonB